MRSHQATASRLGRVLGGVLFVLALSAIAALNVPAFLGYRTMIVTGGSMLPTIEPGDAVLMKRAAIDTLGPGQVVAYLPVGMTKPTTHRIISVHRIKGELFLRTQGDANQTPDPNLAPATSVLGRMALRVPSAGSAINLLTSLMGRLLLIGLPVVVLLGLETRALLRDRRRDAPPVDAKPQVVGFN